MASTRLSHGLGESQSWPRLDSAVAYARLSHDLGESQSWPRLDSAVALAASLSRGHGLGESQSWPGLGSAVTLLDSVMALASLSRSLGETQSRAKNVRVL